MRTTLPNEIKSLDDAKKLIKDLVENNESFHPEDDPHHVIWHDTEVSGKELDLLTKLFNQVYDLPEVKSGEFDPCDLFMDLENGMTVLLPEPVAKALESLDYDVPADRFMKDRELDEITDSMDMTELTLIRKTYLDSEPSEEKDKAKLTELIIDRFNHKYLRKVTSIKLTNGVANTLNELGYTDEVLTEIETGRLHEILKVMPEHHVGELSQVFVEDIDLDGPIEEMVYFYQKVMIEAEPDHYYLAYLIVHHYVARFNLVAFVHYRDERLH